jgi:hypothetical protein
MRLLLVAVLLTGCSAGTPAYDSCVEHSVEEGVDRAAAEDACEAVVTEARWPDAVPSRTVEVARRRRRARRTPWTTRGTDRPAHVASPEVGGMTVNVGDCSVCGVASRRVCANTLASPRAADRHRVARTSARTPGRLQRTVHSPLVYEHM